MIFFTLLLSSSLTPFLAAFLIDLMSVSRVFEVSSIKNLSPLSSPISCPSI